MKENYIVRADFFGDIRSNHKLSFWVAESRGILQFTAGKMEYRPVAAKEISFEVEINKIVKVKMLSLKPGKNQWVKSFWGSPFIFMFWNPFWNKYLLNITYLGNLGMPRELFFKLKTRRITEETMEILKRKR